jgi:hypothetical protein
MDDQVDGKITGGRYDRGPDREGLLKPQLAQESRAGCRFEPS